MRELRTTDFNYHLPPELIAQTPVEPRDASRLLVLERSTGAIAHRRFADILDYLRPGDVMVFNDSRVIPARLTVRKQGSGGIVELLLLRNLGEHTWEALVRPARRVRTGAVLELGEETGVTAEVVGEGEAGIRALRFSEESRMAAFGEIALPPYIRTPLGDPARYQTVYADAPGSVAAPTAGLHFTPELLERIRDIGVSCQFVTLHVGLDTFRPVQEHDPSHHHIHREYGILPAAVAAELTRAKTEKRRVICAGTTSVRLVEAAVTIGAPGVVRPLDGWVDLYILPGYRFRIVDAMVTNFHLPRSTLLMLVSAFAGRALVKDAYGEAIKERYSFYSFGDAMLVI